MHMDMSATSTVSDTCNKADVARLCGLQCRLLIICMSIRNSSHTHQPVDNVVLSKGNQASLLLAYSSQLTNRVNEDGKCVPTFQDHHHLGAAGNLPLRTAGGRGLVSLKQLVHLPLDVWGAPVAVALGDGEPLAHGWRRETRVFLPRCGLTRGDKDTEKRSWSACCRGPLSPCAKFISGYSVLGGVTAVCRVIRCERTSGPAHQPVSGNWLPRAWVLKPTVPGLWCRFKKI